MLSLAERLDRCASEDRDAVLTSVSFDSLLSSLQDTHAPNMVEAAIGTVFDALLRSGMLRSFVDLYRRAKPIREEVSDMSCEGERLRNLGIMLVHSLAEGRGAAAAEEVPEGLTELVAPAFDLSACVEAWEMMCAEGCVSGSEGEMRRAICYTIHLCRHPAAHASVAHSERFAYAAAGYAVRQGCGGRAAELLRRVTDLLRDAFEETDIIHRVGKRYGPRVGETVRRFALGF